MTWASTLQIRKHGYFGDLNFIILFVGILPSYAINLGDASLFADSPFMFLAMFVFDVLYQFE
ncbi:transmembrane protein, putative [Medicago truncatula]|uniref:Transmembrane protein, putative n=1 Tax=Medicago truncatula TaxID=3880 RepID=G7IRN7_MEDTR|nr:transmembrane protein, putative [Medicago truncatula]